MKLYVNIYSNRLTALVWQPNALWIYILADSNRSGFSFDVTLRRAVKFLSLLMPLGPFEWSIEDSGETRKPFFFFIDIRKLFCGNLSQCCQQSCILCTLPSSCKLFLYAAFSSWGSFEITTVLSSGPDSLNLACVNTASSSSLNHFKGALESFQKIFHKFSVNCQARNLSRLAWNEFKKIIPTGTPRSMFNERRQMRVTTFYVQLIFATLIFC